MKAPAGYDYCPGCGHDLRVETCDHCHAELPAGAKYCSDCGERVGDPEVIETCDFEAPVRPFSQEEFRQTFGPPPAPAKEPEITKGYYIERAQALWIKGEAQPQGLKMGEVLADALEFGLGLAADFEQPPIELPRGKCLTRSFTLDPSVYTRLVAFCGEHRHSPFVRWCIERYREHLRQPTTPRNGIQPSA